MMRRLFVLTAVTLGLMVPAFASAHPHDDHEFDAEKAKERFEKRSAKRKEVLARVQQVRAERIGEIEELSDKQKDQLIEALEDFDKVRLESQEAKHTAMLDLRLAMSQESPSDREVGAALSAVRAAEKDLHKAKEDKLDAIEDILEPVQLAKFMMAERRFEREVKMRIRDHHRQEKMERKHKKRRMRRRGMEEF